jgi:hypothetical protein
LRQLVQFITRPNSDYKQNFTAGMPSMPWGHAALIAEKGPHTHIDIIDVFGVSRDSP